MARLEHGLVKRYCDCDHLRMEPGAPLYQRETVYLAADVDSLLQQRQEELVKRMTAWNMLRDGYDESIAQLQHQLAAMTGPGSPYARWQRMLEALERRFPDPQPYQSSCPAEARYLEAIDGLIAQLAALRALLRQREEEIEQLSLCGCVDDKGHAFAACQGCKGTGTRSSI